MFKKVTQTIVNQVEPSGGLIPVHSIIDHEHFRPLCLVRQKEKTMFHRSPSYKQTWHRLTDFLLPGEDNNSTDSLLPSGGDKESRQFTVRTHTNDRVDGNLSFCVDSVSTELKAAASSSKGWSIKLDKNHIPLPKLEALTTERKINMDHPFIQQLQKTRERLYVVHETIETSEEACYEESKTAEGCLIAQLYAKFHAKGTRDKKQSLTIPKGCTLAFKAIQLDITDKSWYLRYFEDRQYICDGFSGGKLGALEGEIKENCQILSQLSSDLSVTFLKAIKAVMRDRNLFEELNHKMDEVLDETRNCELKTESPDLKDLFSSLQYSSRHLLLKLAGAITYTLDALDELTEDQLLLLLESLEEKAVSQQLKLIGIILEHRNVHLNLDDSLLSSSQQKVQKITIAMLEMSGVKFQKDGSAVCMEEAFSATAALYVSLYILSVLSNSN
ncbi:gasdermin-A [Falco cherrug]|uniref:gasdermin-A n=1 Tax=Falco cherrug TaxID=345164 RepID=UPI00247B130E|nr:gasdermin-A [Falco cherrug]XP_014135543.2 gasdermin-A [Falco cherrug]